MIRVVLPYHLRILAQVHQEVELQVEEDATMGAVLDRLESSFPVLRGTVRDQVTKQRRPFLRFFACGQDLTFEPEDTLLPAAVRDGSEPFRIIGAMAGG